MRALENIHARRQDILLEIALELFRMLKDTTSITTPLGQTIELSDDDRMVIARAYAEGYVVSPKNDGYWGFWRERWKDVKRTFRGFPWLLRALQVGGGTNCPNSRPDVRTMNTGDVSFGKRNDTSPTL